MCDAGHMHLCLPGKQSGGTLVVELYVFAQLVGKGGCFEGKRFMPLTDTKTVFSEDDGIIRALIVRYIKVVKNGIVEAKSDGNWKLVGLDPSLSREKAAIRTDIELVKALKTFQRFLRGPPPRSARAGDGEIPSAPTRRPKGDSIDARRVRTAVRARIAPASSTFSLRSGENRISCRG